MRRRTSRRQRSGSTTLHGGQRARMVLDEVKYFTELAAARDARLVTLGSLVFFSTDTGDAWLLDPDDDLALCLARDGVALPVDIKETPERFAIEWTSTYKIEGEVMLVIDRAGRTRRIHGYPTQAIAEAISRRKYLE